MMSEVNSTASKSDTSAGVSIAATTSSNLVSNVSNSNTSKQSSASSGSTLNPAGCWVTHKRLEAWAKVAKERALNCTSPRILRNGFSKSLSRSKQNLNQEFKDQPTVQSAQAASPSCASEFIKSSNETHPTSSPSLQHQSKSYPSGSQPRLARTPSVSSQGSFDSIVSKQHRGSSPQIRTYGPDGKFHSQSSESSDPQPAPTRSPSPLPHRASSLDARSSSCFVYSSSNNDLRTCGSISQTNLASLANVSNAMRINTPGSPRCVSAYGRCLSPLLIPSKAPTDMPLPPASPLGTLQPDLYQKKDGPVFLGNSLKSGQSLGRIHLRLKYDFDRSDLEVHLIEAHDLVTSDQGGFSNPYVKVGLSPPVDKRKRQTTFVHNDANPYFNQHFKFPVSHEDLQDKSLVLQVIDNDRFSRSDIIGEVKITMKDFDVTLSVEVWGDITKIKKPPEEIQEVLLSLSYLPSAERLTVVVLKARNLFLPHDKETIDPFVKVSLIVSGKKVKKRKTALRKATTNPVWNEALSFSLQSSGLFSAALEICVLDQATEFISSNPLVGVCVIGPNEEGAEKDHWVDMIHSPRKAVATWHVLR